MKTTLMFLTVVALCTTLLIYTSCKKSKMNKETTSEQDNNTAENLFDDVTGTVDQSADEGNLSGKTATPASETALGKNCSCANTSVVPPAWDTTTTPWTWNATFPKTMTIDFGTGCTCGDGKTRKGKIIVTVTGKYREQGTKITWTTDNYYVNDYKIEGTKAVENMGKNSNNQTYFTITVTGGKITTPDNETITWESSRVRTWIEGENTGFFTMKSDSTGIMGLLGITDDVYSVSGSGSGTNRDGITFTVTITSDLRIQFCTGYHIEITDGTVEIQPDGLKKRVVEFGDASCDNQATVTVGNKTKTIQLHG